MLYLYIALGAAAAAATIFIALLGRPVAAGRQACPGALSLGWRLSWPWLAVLAPLCQPLASWRSRKKLEIQLQRADLDACLSVGYVLAARWLSGWLAAAIVLILARVFVDAPWPHAALAALGSMAVCSRLPDSSLARRARGLCRQIQRQLPFYLDIISLCLEAGLNLQGALQQAAQGGPQGALRDQLLRVLADVRAGTPRLQALTAMATRTGLPSVRNWVSVLVQADGLGLSLGPLLREQAAQRRTERFQCAERLAMQAPVKMLMPLIVCIFPCTFLVIGFPIVLSLLQATA